MAISGVIRSYTTGGQGLVAREDLEDVIAMISPTETPLFTMLNRKTATNIKHEWPEDTLRGMSDVLAAAVSVGQAFIRVNNGATRIPCATSYPTMLRIEEEIIAANSRVTNFVNVTRGYNGSATAAHASNSTVEVIADLSIDGADARTAFAQTRTRPYNMCQVFDSTVLVSGSAKALAQAGIVGTEVDYQVQRRMEELAIQVERALVTGTRVDGSTTTYRSMGGLWHFVSTNKNNSSGVAVTKANVYADAKQAYDSGGRPGVLLANTTQAEKIAQLFESSIRSAPEEIFGGQTISRIRMPWAGGGELAIIVNRWVPQHEYYILDMDKLGLAVFRPFGMAPLAKTGDAEKDQIIGEYTLEVKNEKAHSRRYNLATT